MGAHTQCVCVCVFTLERIRILRGVSPSTRGRTPLMLSPAKQKWYPSSCTLHTEMTSGQHAQPTRTRQRATRSTQPKTRTHRRVTKLLPSAH